MAQKRPTTDMGILDGIEKIRASLDYHLARHNVLTSNLAHVDTPNFKPLDLQRTDGFNSALGSAMVQTNPMHLGGAGEGASGANGASAQNPAFKVVEDPSSASGYDGNGVSIDREAVKIATNHVRYETLAQLASSELSGLSWAANDGKLG